MSAFNGQNPSLSEDFFQETINKTTKTNTAYYHYDEMGEMLGGHSNVKGSIRLVQKFT